MLSLASWIVGDVPGYFLICLFRLEKSVTSLYSPGSLLGMIIEGETYWIVTPSSSGVLKTPHCTSLSNFLASSVLIWGE